jgi:hypothetical protein
MRGAGIVENKIKSIKNRARSIVNSLSYVLPNSLVKYLVYFSTQAVNMVLTMNSNLTTPLEKFIGRKLDFRVDLSKLRLEPFPWLPLSEALHSLRRRGEHRSYIYRGRSAGNVCLRRDDKQCPLLTSFQVGVQWPWAGR